MHLQPNIPSINYCYQRWISREHGYRGDLQQLLESLTEEVMVPHLDAAIAHLLARRYLP